MADVHIFDVRIAKMYGVNCAVILQNIWHWVQKNEANGTNFYDGAYWTYNSTKAFAAQFPYLSKKQIETALKKLRDEKIIMTGNYNTMKYDRTLWYAITEKGKSILLAGEMDLTNGVNGFPSEVTPIPYINTDVTTDVKPYEDIISYLNEKAGTKYKPSSAKSREKIDARLNDGFTLEDFKTVIDKKCADWLHDPKMCKFLRPETLFGPKFEGYLNEINGKEGYHGKRQSDYRTMAEKVGTYL
ncbi:MAG: conserved phage C-terminal domain-containing protein [Oscillospiraceae bacterium]|nr:conserved phage C-terminal domain-containing protein [Oscillospiraceae bacterium]